MTQTIDQPVSASSAVKRYVIGQFRKPHGMAGRLAGVIMAWRGSNRLRNQWTVDLLDIRPGYRVLEIGFGPGLGIEMASEAADAVTLVGIDHSESMLRMASARNREAIREKRVTLMLGDADCPDSLPDVGSVTPFDRVFGVNVQMFLHDRVKVFAGLIDRMRPGGLLAFTYQPRTGPMTDEAALTAARGMADDMALAGLTDVRVERLDTVSPIAVCVLGRRCDT